MKQVLFVCVHNAGRSQMAEAFFNHLASGKAGARSAGTQPAAQVHTVVVEAMAEVGIDLTAHRPQEMALEMAEEADRVVTMGCSLDEVCPAPLLERAEEWSLEDPAGQSLEKVREIRDEVRRRVEGLLAELTLAEEGGPPA